MQRKFVRLLATLGMSAALLVGTAPKAEAAFSLGIDWDNNGTIDNTWTDLFGMGCVAGNPADNSCIQGLIGLSAFSGDGNWTVSGTGVSKPFMPGSTPATPGMDLNALAITTVSGGTVSLYLTDTDWSTGMVGGSLNIGGTTNAGGTITYSVYYDLGNTAFATTSLVGTAGPFTGPGFFGGAAGGVINGDAAYSITQKITISHTGTGTSSFDAEFVAPEPTTIGLFGLALFGLAGAARRRFNG